MSIIVSAACCLDKNPIPENWFGQLTIGSIGPIPSPIQVKLTIQPEGRNQGFAQFTLDVPMTGDVVWSITEAQNFFRGASMRGKFCFSLKDASTYEPVQWIEGTEMYDCICLCFTPCEPNMVTQNIVLTNKGDGCDKCP